MSGVSVAGLNPRSRVHVGLVPALASCSPAENSHDTHAVCSCQARYVHKTTRSLPVTSLCFAPTDSPGLVAGNQLAVMLFHDVRSTGVCFRPDTSWSGNAARPRRGALCPSLWASPPPALVGEARPALPARSGTCTLPLAVLSPKATPGGWPMPFTPPRRAAARGGCILGSLPKVRTPGPARALCGARAPEVGDPSLDPSPGPCGDATEPGDAKPRLDARCAGSRPWPCSCRLVREKWGDPRPGCKERDLRAHVGQVLGSSFFP